MFYALSQRLLGKLSQTAKTCIWWSICWRFKAEHHRHQIAQRFRMSLFSSFETSKQAVRALKLKAVHRRWPLQAHAPDHIDLDSVIIIPSASQMNTLHSDCLSCLSWTKFANIQLAAVMMCCCQAVRHTSWHIHQPLVHSLHFFCESPAVLQHPSPPRQTLYKLQRNGQGTKTADPVLLLSWDENDTGQQVSIGFLAQIGSEHLKVSSGIKFRIFNKLTPLRKL